MGHKKVCLYCKTSFNRAFDFGSSLTYPCPECNKPMVLLPHRFRPPLKSDNKKWETVKYLIENGFSYQHIYEVINDQFQTVTYPDNLRDALEFVEKYKSQALK